MCGDGGSRSNDLRDQIVTAVQETKDATPLGLGGISATRTMDGFGIWFEGRVERHC